MSALKHIPVQCTLVVANTPRCCVGVSAGCQTVGTQSPCSHVDDSKCIAPFPVTNKKQTQTLTVHPIMWASEKTTTYIHSSAISKMW